MIVWDGDDLGAAFERLRVEDRIQRISAIGGAVTATHLVDAGLIRDIYLTTTSLEGGEPGTPWYRGRNPPQLMPITSKEWQDRESRMVFDHYLLKSHRESSSEFRPTGESGSP
jgi:dihydrofolate reductase